MGGCCPKKDQSSGPEYTKVKGENTTVSRTQQGNTHKTGETERRFDSQTTKKDLELNQRSPNNVEKVGAPSPSSKNAVKVSPKVQHASEPIKRRSENKNDLPPNTIVNGTSSDKAQKGFVQNVTIPRPAESAPSEQDIRRRRMITLASNNHNDAQYYQKEQHNQIYTSQNTFHPSVTLYSIDSLR
jgi:hypothetical protein